jgi:predicted RecB family endonuclease
MTNEAWKHAEQTVAKYLRAEGFELATTHRSALGRNGVRQEADIIGVPGCAIEVKARRNLDILGSLRQAEQAAVGRQIPIVVSKPIGVGLNSVGFWPCFLYLRHLVPLLPREGEL